MAVLLAQTLLFTACGQEEETVAADNTVKVNIEEVSVGNLSLTGSFVGTVTPESIVYVVPLVSGTVTETFAEVGDYVEEGDVLFTIDDTLAQMTLKQAKLSKQNTDIQSDVQLEDTRKKTEIELESGKMQTNMSYNNAQIAYCQAKEAYQKSGQAYTQTDAALKQAQSNLAALTPADPGYAQAVAAVTAATTANEQAKAANSQAYYAYCSASSAYDVATRSKELAAESEAMAREQLEKSLSDTEKQLSIGKQLAQLGVDQAELALDYYTVKAPVSGIVESKSVDVDGLVGQTSAAYVISGKDTMTVTFAVGESVKNTLSVGQTIRVERSDREYTATVTEIGASVSQQTGLFSVKATVAADGNALPAGVSVKIYADTYETKNAVLIPYSAVYYDTDGAYVYTEVNGVAEKTPIKTGLYDDETLEVVSGLQAGDHLVTSWSPQLTQGALLQAAE